MENYQLTKQDWAWWHGLDNIWKKIFTAHIYHKNKIEFDGLDRWSCTLIKGYGILNLLDPQDLGRVLRLDDIYCTGFGNLLTDIRPLERLTYLSTLDVDGSDIQDISPLANLTYLTEVSLRMNQLQDISALSKLNNLNKLYLDDNHIQDIDILAHLMQLTKLHISNNPLSTTQIDWLKKQLPECNIYFY